MGEVDLNFCHCQRFNNAYPEKKFSGGGAIILRDQNTILFLLNAGQWLSPEPAGSPQASVSFS